MELWYDGVDIAGRVSITQADVIDCAGGRFDGLEVSFNDPDGQWSGWHPETGHTLRLRCGGFDTGLCYIVDIGQGRGTYTLRAISAPSAAKYPHSRSWERVTLLQLAQDCAAAYGFAVLASGVPELLYDRIDQQDETDFTFLQRRCELEGIALKVTGGRVVLYDEHQLEQTGTQRHITGTEFVGSFDYSCNDAARCGSCVVSWGGISASFDTGTPGPVLRESRIYLTSAAEAGRYARGLVRARNKEADTLTGTIPFAPDLAGGSMVRVTGLGTADGIYRVDEVEHRIMDGQSDLRLCRRLEGY